MSERQLRFGFTATLPDQAETPKPDGIEQIAASLRPRVLAYLGDVGRAVGIHALRSALGHPVLDTEPDPQANPVNRILKEMRDAGEIVCNEPEWGEPTFSLPEATRTEPAGDVFAPDSQGQGMESVADHHRPYTLDDYRTFRGRLDEGQLTAADLQTDFRRLQDSREQFIAGLQQTYNATQLRSLASCVGCFDARRNNKGQNAAAIFRNLSGSFALGRSVMYQPMSGESYEDAVAKVVAGITDDDVAGFVEEHHAEAAREQKAIENPETLDEFQR